MKIDLHLHTPASKINGDTINWKSSVNTMKTLFNNGIGAIAFTDHNIFDLKTYEDCKKIAGKHLIVFPGIEINILKSSGIIAHLLLIFDNQLDKNQLKNLSLLSKRYLRKSGIKVEQVYEIYKDFDFIAIPHVGKSDHFKIDELNFRHEAVEISSLKNVNYKTWKKNLSNKSVVAFSDTHVWKDYPQNNSLETYIDFDGTFGDLKNKLTNNKKDYTRRK